MLSTSLPLCFIDVSLFSLVFARRAPRRSFGPSSPIGPYCVSLRLFLSLSMVSSFVLFIHPSSCVGESASRKASPHVVLGGKTLFASAFTYSAPWCRFVVSFVDGWTWAGFRSFYGAAFAFSIHRQCTWLCPRVHSRVQGYALCTCTVCGLVGVDSWAGCR